MDKKLIDRYIKFFYAASNYYGAIELDEFVDAYFKEEDFDDLYELFFVSFDNKLINAYKIKDRYYLTCYDKKGLKECLRQQSNKPLKIISEIDLLKYAEKNYYKDNNLTIYMKSHGASEEIVLDVVNNMSSIYFNLGDTFKYLLDALDESIKLEELLDTLTKAYNNTPIHANRGYSPKELSNN